MNGSIRTRPASRRAPWAVVVALAVTIVVAAAWRADAAPHGSLVARAPGSTATSSSTGAPAIEVALEPEGQVDAGSMMLRVTVANTGAAPLENVVVHPLFDMLPDTLRGPDLSLGADDDLVLEPAERWLYRCVTLFPGYAEVEVTAETADGVTVTGSASWEVSSPGPLRVRLAASDLSVVSGDSVEWVVDATNVTDVPLAHPGASGTLWAGWTATYSGSPISDTTPMTLVGRGTDGDETMDPDETWRWTYRATVTQDGTYLMATLLVASPYCTPGCAFNFASRAISVEAGSASTTVAPPTTAVVTTQPTASPTTRPGATELPATGQAASATLVAALVLALGGALAAVATRRS